MLAHWSWSDDLDHTKEMYPMIFLLPFVGLCLESISAPLGEWGGYHFFFWTVQACWKKLCCGGYKKNNIYFYKYQPVYTTNAEVPVLPFASRSLAKSSFQSIKRMTNRIKLIKKRLYSSINQRFSSTQSFLSTANAESSINHTFIDWTVAAYLVISEYSQNTTA